MAFRLVVARGNHQGAQFIAVQSEVFVGRESGNDVVLSDAGVSGRHARFREQDGRFFVSDCGTANGTLLNGQSVQGEHELKAGDAIALGTAVVQFLGEVESSKKRLMPEGIATSPQAPTGGRAAVAREADTEPTAPMGRSLLAREEKTEKAARPLSLQEIAEAMATKGGAVSDALAGDTTAPSKIPVDATYRDLPMVPEVPERDRDTAAAELPIGAVQTALVPNLPAEAQVLTQAASVLVPAFSTLTRAPDLSAVATAIKRDEPAPIPDAFQRLPEGGALPATTAARPSNILPLEDPATAGDATAPRGVPIVEPPRDDRTAPRGASLIAETAADKARKRRAAQATLGGQLAYLWGELSLRSRAVLITVLAIVGAVIGFGLMQVFRPPPAVQLPPEPLTLSGSPIPYGFGLGDVDYEHVDFKELRFEVKAPTTVAVLVHYQAQDIGTDEVSIAANGAELGFVPADVGLPDRELEVVLSPFVLKRNETNTIVFDNVKNPPGHERWRIAHLWLELIPVPEATKDAAIAASRSALERGASFEKQHASGDDMLFRAWRAYREGWIALLNLQEDQRGPLYAELKRRSDALRFALDTQCGTLMLDAKKQMELKNPDGAREILEGVPRFFPTKDHPCHALAEEKLAEYEL